MHSEGMPMRESIMAAAVEMFAMYGYHAAPLRDIARKAGIQAASIYHHYPSKQALLMEIMESHMQRLNYALEQIMQQYDEPLQQLREAIASHIRLHTSYKEEFFIIDTEIRALEGENRTAILAMRDHYEQLLQEILRDGVEQDIFRRGDVKVESYAIIAMCTAVASWFRPDGRLSVQQVIEMYREMIIPGLLAKRE